ncbi:MAG: DNA-directed RNA polymerase subunit P [Candidatus Bathyarchaeia archaeon]
MATDSQPTGVIYQCVQCGREIAREQLLMMLEIKCPNCGYRVLRKTRPPVVKRVKAR